MKISRAYYGGRQITNAYLGTKSLNFQSAGFINIGVIDSIQLASGQSSVAIITEIISTAHTDELSLDNTCNSQARVVYIVPIQIGSALPIVLEDLSNAAKISIVNVSHISPYLLICNDDERANAVMIVAASHAGSMEIRASAGLTAGIVWVVQAAPVDSKESITANGTAYPEIVKEEGLACADQVALVFSETISAESIVHSWTDPFYNETTGMLTISQGRPTLSAGWLTIQ